MQKRMTDAERQALEAAFVTEAQKQFARMFDPGEQPALITFAEREARAMEIARTLGQRILETHVQQDAAMAPGGAAAAACPQCGQPAARCPAAPAGEPAREVLAEPGRVAFRRPEFRCTRCRRVFFSGRPRAAARHRGL